MLRGWLPIIIALILGSIASVAAFVAIHIEKEEVIRGWELENVLAASEDIPVGTIITDDMLVESPMPRQFIYDSIMLPSDREYAIGREALVTIKKGEPLHWHQLRGLREKEKLSDQIRPGSRAVTINVTADTAVGFWIRPNDTVDIIGIFMDPVNQSQVAITLLQNVPVLATGKESAMLGSSQDEEYETLTLQVLPQEAEILALAQSVGKLHLTLRNREDQSVIEERTRTTLDTLFSESQLRMLEERRRKVIEIIRGLQNKINIK